MAPKPTTPVCLSRLTVARLTPPSAYIGRRTARTTAARALAPKARPAEGLLLAKMGENTMASAPPRATRSAAGRECAAAVTRNRWRSTRIAPTRPARRSGRCTPSARSRVARAASAPTMKITPRLRAAFANIAPVETALAWPKARKTMAAPRGRTDKVDPGSEVRMGSVKKSMGARPLDNLRRGPSVRAARQSVWMRPSFNVDP